MKHKLDATKVYGIKDRFHKWINGDDKPEVLSTQFESVKEFSEWVEQHGVELSSQEVYIVDDSFTYIKRNK